MAASRKGRGRPSSIERLPKEAADIIAWAHMELHGRRDFQKDILVEFNEKLAAIGLGPISKTAFNRHSIRLAHDTREREGILHIATALSGLREVEQIDDLTLLCSEAIKTLVYELLGDPDVTPKEALELSRAYQAAVNSEKVSIGRKQEMDRHFEAQVDDALDKVVEEKGLGKDRADALKRELLGLKT